MDRQLREEEKKMGKGGREKEKELGKKQDNEQTGYQRKETEKCSYHMCHLWPFP